jgi:hypothetical protein
MNRQQYFDLPDLLFGILSGSLFALSATIIEKTNSSDSLKSNITPLVFSGILFSVGAALGTLSVYTANWRGDVAVVLTVFGMLFLVGVGVARTKKQISLYIAMVVLYTISFTIVGVLSGFDNVGFTWLKSRYTLFSSLLFIVSGIIMISTVYKSSEINDDYSLIITALAWALIGVGGSLRTNRT